MKSEEYLDRLIDGYEREELPYSANNDEITACMKARERVAQLNEIPVPLRFAHNLEYSIRTHIRSLQEQDYRDASPTRPLVAIEQNHSYEQTNQFQASVRSRAGYKRRSWMALLQIAAVLIITAIGALTASMRALPGDALYSLNQAEKQFALTFAGAPKNRADIQIANLQNAVVNLNTVVKEGRDDDSIRLALDTVSAITLESQQEVATLPANATQSESQHELANALSEEKRMLKQLLNSVDWQMQLAFTQQLAVLGEPVPTLTQAVVHNQNDGTFLITLSGSYFSSQTQLIINGQQTGIVKQITSSQLVAVTRNVGQAGGAFAVGVRNSDGTAAQLVVNSIGGNSSDRQDDNHSRQGTPVVNPTRRPDD